MKRFGNGYPVCQRCFFVCFFFFFGEARKSEIVKKLFLAFSSSPKKKTSDTQGRQWPIYSLFFCLKRRATGKIGPIFVFTICFRYSFIRLTNRHAKTSLYTYKEGDSGGGVKEPLPFSLLPRPNSLPLQRLPR